MYEFGLFISAIAVLSLVIAILSKIFKYFQKEEIEEDEFESTAVETAYVEAVCQRGFGRLTDAYDYSKTYRESSFSEDAFPLDKLVGRSIIVTAEKSYLEEIGIDRSLTNNKGVIIENYDNYWFSVVFHLTLGCGIEVREQYSMTANSFKLIVDESTDKED